MNLEYNRLDDYTAEFRRSNTYSHVKEDVRYTILSANPNFHGSYICFDACRKGFIANCRPIIKLDGYFMKGPCNGEILLAIGRDGNN